MTIPMNRIHVEPMVIPLTFNLARHRPEVIAIANSRMEYAVPLIIFFPIFNFGAKVLIFKIDI